MKIILSMLAIIFLGGCGTVAGISAAGTRSAMVKLERGMDKEQVRQIMGRPNKTEAYPDGVTYWLYRTETNDSFYGIHESVDDKFFTPLCFDDSGVLVGWGRNYYIEQTKRYKVDINTTSRIPEE